MTTQPNPQDDHGEQTTRIEAILFAGGPALDTAQIMELIGTDQESLVVEAVARLNQHYFRQGRPYEIRRARAGLQMVLRPEFASIVRRLRGHSREVRLSVAAIEVLSIIAYRQPVDLSTVDSVRGVDSSAIVRQLRRRNLIEPVAAEQGESRSGQYQTTKRFLELFHLRTLEDLPRVQELEKA